MGGVFNGSSSKAGGGWGSLGPRIPSSAMEKVGSVLAVMAVMVMAVSLMHLIPIDGDLLCRLIAIHSGPIGI